MIIFLESINKGMVILKIKKYKWRMESNHQKYIGYTELALAQCCVGLNVITGKFLITLLPIFFLLFVRFMIGMLGMLAIARYKHITIKTIYRSFMKLSLHDRWLLIIQAACGGFLFNVFILWGMKHTSAVSAGIITSATPIFIFILAFIFLHERVNKQKILAIITAMLGLVVLNTGKVEAVGATSLIGNLLVLLAVIPEAFFTILSKSIGKKLHQLEAVTLVNFFNVLMFIPFLFIDIPSLHGEYLNANTIMLIILYGVTGGMLFFLLWYRGLTRVPANIAALFTGVMPVSTTVLAFLFLQEPIHLSDMVGMLLVILAIFIGCYGGLRTKNVAACHPTSTP